MEQEKTGIFTAISKVMEEIGAIGKEKKNVQQGFIIVTGKQIGRAHV